MNRFIEIARKIVISRFFNYFIFSLILLAALIIGLETYPGLANQYQYVLLLADQIVIILFTLEIGIKIISNGKRPWLFFSDP